jgi:rhodanese-related sulfurtransferase
MPKQITPSDLSVRMGAGQSILLLDVRDPEEHAFAKIDGSMLIPLAELIGRVGEVEPPDDVPIVVYCHHGIRSATGAALLERAGHANVLSLAGGIDAWSCEVDPSVPRY